VLPRIGFVAQEHPLYRGFTVAETFRLGRELNPSWNEDAARARVEALFASTFRSAREDAEGTGRWAG